MEQYVVIFQGESRATLEKAASPDGLGSDLANLCYNVGPIGCEVVGLWAGIHSVTAALVTSVKFNFYKAVTVDAASTAGAASNLIGCVCFGTAVGASKPQITYKFLTSDSCTNGRQCRIIPPGGVIRCQGTYQLNGNISVSQVRGTVGIIARGIGTFGDVTNCPMAVTRTVNNTRESPYPSGFRPIVTSVT